MAETNHGFTPSINIERDYNKKLNYVVTSNARHIYDQIVNNRYSGNHSFSIIGSYGTGKSSFLLALKNNLIEEGTNYFTPLNGQFSDINDFKFDLIVGRYGSLIENLAVHLGLAPTVDGNELLRWVANKHQELKKENIFWFIVIDEFGKHLEYAAKEAPEKELYFVQQLSELVNEEQKNIYFVTTLHQAFDSYAHGLDLQQRKEWDKVRGRLKELTFNEPVEQLLFIASEYLKQDKRPDKKTGKKLLTCIENAHVFPLKNELDSKLAENLYPIDPLAAGILALALQKYGQNERSLFTFLQSNDYGGINNFDDSHHPYYNLSCVYDYLIYNHHHYISSKYNPHYLQWNSIKKALQRIESELQDNLADAKKLIKTIGLLNLFSLEGAKIDTQFIKQYGQLALGIQSGDKLITTLTEKQIIRYRSHKQQFILFEGTDLDIDFELQNATSKIEPVIDVVSALTKHFYFPFVPAKRVFYKKGTPRFFEFKLTHQPHQKTPKQPIDGFINLVFEATKEKVIKQSQNNTKPILHGIYRNTEQIKDYLFKLKQIEYVQQEVADSSDRVAKRELSDLHDHIKEELNDYVLTNIYNEKNDIDWIFNGEQQPIHDMRSLNETLSVICDSVYEKTPAFNNELINKERVSPAIYKPRKELLKLLLHNADQKDLGFDDKSFPAEKTIYLSLLSQTGIHKYNNGQWQLGAPKAQFFDLWERCEAFFESTKTGKRKLIDLITILRKPPFGLKMGLIELWIPIYLIIKKDDFALFKGESYVIELDYDMLNLVYRNPKLFEIKAFHISDVKKKIFEKYRSVLNQDEDVAFSNESFVETVKPFLLIYNELNEYGRTNTKISASAQKLREAIKSATDPEEAFFEQFVNALGYLSLSDLQSDKAIQQFGYQLDKRIEEIKNAYDNLIQRIEECLLNALEIEDSNFESYKKQITSRYESVKRYKLAPYQKKLLDRLLSNHAERDKWIEAVAFAILDKPLSKIDDEEEPLLLDRLTERIEVLDNLRELSILNINTDKEEAYRLQLDTFSGNSIKENVVVEKDKLEVENGRYKELKHLLTDNKKVNLSLLIKLIEEQIS